MKYTSALTPKEYKKLILFAPFLILFIGVVMAIVLPIRAFLWLMNREVAELEITNI